MNSITNPPQSKQSKTTNDLSFLKKDIIPVKNEVVPQSPASEMGIAKAGLEKNVFPPLYPDLTNPAKTAINNQKTKVK